jgi:integrase
VINELSKHRLAQKQTMLKHRDIYHDEDLVFTCIDEELPGYPLYIKKIENRMRRLLKVAELNRALTLHTLRHTHTSLLAEAGVSLPQIMQRLGHKDEDTTKHVYLHVKKRDEKRGFPKVQIYLLIKIKSLNSYF